MSPVKVISQQPPGGRCTLYARYADAIADTLGWSHRIVHDECREAHSKSLHSRRSIQGWLQPGHSIGAANAFHLPFWCVKVKFNTLASIFICDSMSLAQQARGTEISP